MSETLTQKCARAMALMEEAQALIAEVLDDPEYDIEALPNGVYPPGVEDYLPSAIGMLMPEPDPQPGDDDYIPVKRLSLVVDNARSHPEPQP